MHRSNLGARPGQLRRGRALATLLLLGVAIASCGGDSTGAPAASPTAAATSTPTSTPAAPASIEPVVWATAIEPETNAPSRPVDQLTADVTTIYAVARVANLPAGAQLSATWTYNETALDSVTRTFVLSDAFRSGYVEFHLTRAGSRPWPVGTYAIAIAIDGDVAQSAEIELTER